MGVGVGVGVYVLVCVWGWVWVGGWLCKIQSLIQVLVACLELLVMLVLYYLVYSLYMNLKGETYRHLLIKRSW